MDGKDQVGQQAALPRFGYRQDRREIGRMGWVCISPPSMFSPALWVQSFDPVLVTIERSQMHMDSHAEDMRYLGVSNLCACSIGGSAHGRRRNAPIYACGPCQSGCLLQPLV